ncbi:helix-turn-helix domain-containing protein [Arthrobacter koreensis]|uniref:helix-turn-helix domain-containing protein n=1 Tax=Arthrobacter koreensis TaxID=199136 RepID=UPI000B8A2220|nr:helix-turn-helix domain-containing protein [Arthrobacter koreensis]
MITMKTIPAKAVTATEIEEVEEAVKCLNPESEMTQAIQEMVQLARRGLSVKVLSECEELSPNEAAQVLNVSRPTVLKMIARGELASRLVGNRDQRISGESVLALKERQSMAARDVAAAFAKKSDAITQLVRGASGIDPETAKRLGY